MVHDPRASRSRTSNPHKPPHAEVPELPRPVEELGQREVRLRVQQLELENERLRRQAWVEPIKAVSPIIAAVIAAIAFHFGYPPGGHNAQPKPQSETIIHIDVHVRSDPPDSGRR